MYIVFVLLYLKRQSLEVAIQNESRKKDQKFLVLNGRIEVEIGFYAKANNTRELRNLCLCFLGSREL